MTIWQCRGNWSEDCGYLGFLSHNQLWHFCVTSGSSYVTFIPTKLFYGNWVVSSSITELDCCCLVDVLVSERIWLLCSSATSNGEVDLLILNPQTQPCLCVQADVCCSSAWGWLTCSWANFPLRDSLVFDQIQAVQFHRYGRDTLEHGKARTTW